MTVVNWNVEWATPGSWSRRDEILSRIDREAPDIVCLTESDIRLLAGMPGHTIHSQPDGVKGIDNLRKVLLWSREPWEQVDDFGVDSMPPGRFVSGVTRTPLGDVTILGVCIPYQHSRTKWTDDRVRRKPWEDHRQYLANLPTSRRSVRTGLIEAIDRPARQGGSGAVSGSTARPPGPTSPTILLPGHTSASDSTPCTPGSILPLPRVTRADGSAEIPTPP